MSSLLWFTFAFIVLCAVHCYPLEQGSSDISAEEEGDPVYDNSLKEEESDVSTLIEKANKYVGQELDEPTVIGDIAVPADLGNADPCTSRGCKWEKSSDGTVYVPYVIANQYSSRERYIIERGLHSFPSYTCVRFKPHTTERDFVHIQSRGGCYSYVGRRGGGQVVSLNRQGCIYHGVVQHELLHALGFNHEQTRSDRDEHVRILFENIIQGQEYNFRKIHTNNLGTPYDYSSVMHYGRDAFSKNGQPTIVPIPDSNVEIGKAIEMSRYDVMRINRLYECGRSG
ncbi:hatching enzyme 1.2-like isoform X8 [Anguilla rostrata]|uniref:hatching enzyme 1.2-like isoform X8 n=1 Tax=Anguilla rostrata TaxID=7938 RepID=UPI0030D518AE